MGRALAFAAVAIFLMAVAPAGAQVSRDDVVAAATAARNAVNGDPASALPQVDVLEKILTTLTTDQHLERYLLSASAIILRDTEHYEASAQAFLKAAEALAPFPDQADRQAVQIEAAAYVLGKAKQFDNAFAAYDRALGIRQQTNLLSTQFAVQAAAQRLWLSLADADNKWIEAALSQVSAAVSGYTDTAKQPLVSAYAAMAGALGQLGLYGQMTQMSDLAAGTMTTMRFEVEFGGANPQAKNDVCNRISSDSSLLAEVLTSAGDYYRAGTLLYDHAFGEFCGKEISEGNLRLSRLSQARLALSTGDALAAETRLIEARSDSFRFERAEDTAWSDSLLAATRTQLGFLGQADKDFAKISSGDDLLYSDRQIEWMISKAHYLFLSGKNEDAQDLLRDAERHAAVRRANDWYLRARISYLRAYLLIDDSDLDGASSIVQDFRKLQTQILESAGADAEALVHSQPVSEAVERMEMLYALLSAAASGDRDATESALRRFREIGAPTFPEATYFGQIAHLSACIVLKELEVCSFDLLSAFDAPFNVPYMRTSFVSGQTAYNLSGDRFRYAPLRKRMYRRLSSLLWHSSRAARQRAQEEIPDNRGWEDLSARFAGADTAFELAQMLSEGAANSAAVQVSARLAAGSGPLSELLRQRQDISAEIQRKSRTLLDEGIQADVNADLGKLAAVDKQIAEQYPDYVARYKLPALAVHRLKSLLKADEAIVLINSLDDATDIFVATAETLRWHRSEISQTSLSANVAHLRDGLDPTGGTRAATPLSTRYGRTNFDRFAAHDLYKTLFEGAEDLLKGKTLLVSTNGPLSSLPLSVLVTEPPQESVTAREEMRSTAWLIEKHPIMVLPTVSGLGTRELKAVAPVATSGFAGFGDPVFGGREPDNQTGILDNLAPLPGTRQEIMGLASLFKPGETDIFLGADASETALHRTSLESRKVLAFATHGLMAGELGDGSEPGLALARSAKPFAGDEDDGFLTASEASTLNINAEWLLLSACNTASAANNPDSGGYSGLAQAFLFAGAKSILVSHWPVSDDAAPHLTVNMIRWYEANQSKSKAAALQRAILAMIGDRDNPALAHPSNWAPFVLFGIEN